MTPHHKRGPWSQTEDLQLMSLVQHQGALNWVRIAQYLGTRTPKQCRERYHQNLKPSLNHEPISPEEGAQIERMVMEMGKRWAEIARRLHNRSDNAVKNWWNGSQNRRKRDGRRKTSYHGPHHADHSPVDVHAVLDHHAHLPHHQHHAHHTRHAHLPHARALGPYEEMSEPPNYQAGPPPMRPLAVPRTLPPLTRAVPVPRPLSPAYNSRPYDTPLPSPSALSPGVDSVDGAPSLMSDSGSSYSTSPGGPNGDLVSPIDLPPLKNFATNRPHNCDPLSVTEVKLPSFSCLANPYMPSKGDYRHGSDGHYSPGQHHSHLPTAPNSPVNNLPALRMPAQPSAANHHRPSASKERIEISKLCT